MLITRLDQLRRLYGEPNERAVRNCQRRLDRHCRKFIALSPFVVISTSANGKVDASPHGDQCGFVEVLDDQTLLIPDRPGNGHLDTMTNLLANSAIGLTFFVPGIDETLRVNGNAILTAAPEVLQRFAVEGRLPITAVIVSINQAYLHGADANIRSGLSNPATDLDRPVSAEPNQVDRVGIAPPTAKNPGFDGVSDIGPASAPGFASAGTAR